MVTDSGEVLPADVVVIAVGVVPAVGLAHTAGLNVDNGILTDASLRTSVPEIFAAGDVANALHPFTGEHYRSEHWSNALNGGKVAARAMLGLDATHSTIPYFYTDQFDVSMEYSGFPDLAAGTEPVIRGSLEDKEFIAFWQRDSRVVAGMSVNWPRTAGPGAQKVIKALISGRNPVGPGPACRRLNGPGSGAPAGGLTRHRPCGLDGGFVPGHPGLPAPWNTHPGVRQAGHQRRLRLTCGPG